MPRGGRRTGTPGKNYPNRTDMALGPRQLPNVTAPGQAYGEAKQQHDAMAQVPITTGPDIGNTMQAAQQFNPPPTIPIATPSMNPTEHVMTPPAQPLFAQQSPVLKGAALLNALGNDASPEAKAIRAVLNAVQGNQAAP